MNIKGRILFKDVSNYRKTHDIFGNKITMPAPKWLKLKLFWGRIVNIFNRKSK